MLIGLLAAAHLVAQAIAATGQNVAQQEWAWAVLESLRFLSHKDENGNIF
jgi:hypothetical protein